MGLSRLESSRGGRPFVFFRGTPDELARLEPKRLAKFMREAGYSKEGRIAYRGNFPFGKQANLNPLVFEEWKKSVIGALGSLEPGKRALLPVPSPYSDGLKVILQLSRTNSGKVSVMQHPSLHTIYNDLMHVDAVEPHMLARDSFDTLKSIFGDSFLGRNFPNSVTRRRTAYNAYTWPSKSPRTRGDYYSIELMTPVYVPPDQYGAGDYLTQVWRASPSQILRVNVFLSRGLDKGALAERKAFYRNELPIKAISFFEQK